MKVQDNLIEVDGEMLILLDDELGPSRPSGPEEIVIDFTIIQIEKNDKYYTDVLDELREQMKWAKLFFDMSC